MLSYRIVLIGLRRRLVIKSLKEELLTWGIKFGRDNFRIFALWDRFHGTPPLKFENLGELHLLDLVFSFIVCGYLCFMLLRGMHFIVVHVSMNLNIYFV